MQVYCRVCQQQKSKDYYYADTLRAAARQTAWIKANPEKVRRYRRRRDLRRYGITPEDYEGMLAAQNGKCKICGKKPGRLRLNVDHDYTTGRVRGLLCGHCNSGIAYFRDDPGRLRAAISYLDNDD